MRVSLRRNYCHNSGQGAGQGMRRAIASPTWPCNCLACHLPVHRRGPMPCAWPVICLSTDAASDMGTPLQWAVMFMRIDIVHMLVAKCACACAATCLPSGAF